MDEGSTTGSRPAWLAGPEADDQDTLDALTIAWSATEPERVGEVALFGPSARQRMLGRGAGRMDDPLPRVRFGRHRPGSFDPGPPLQGRRLSRFQLRIGWSAGALSVARVGRCPMLINGAVAEEGVLRAGDTLLLEDELLLVATQRPRVLAGARAGLAVPFGEADPHGIVGESAAAWALRDEVAYAASLPQHVLLIGPSGAGKELVARAIHARSLRAKRPLVARNAATLPAALFDAELFGHAKDYPNVGMPARGGLLGEADTGTLFLDEVGELAQDLQAHLLRVMDSGGEYHRLGEAASRRVDVRIVAATNRDEADLKHDLLARFGLRVRVPGLDERREDIPLLAAHLLRSWEGDGAREAPLPRFDPSLVERLLHHPFRHNVRELESVLLRAHAKSPPEVLRLTPELAELLATARAASEAPPTKERVEEALASVGGSRERAWRLLGLRNRDVLYRLMKKWGIGGASDGTPG